MGLLKWICSKFGCTSSCMFNKEAFDHDMLNNRLSDFRMSIGDFQKVLKILHKCDTIDKRKTLITTTTTHSEI